MLLLDYREKPQRRFLCESHKQGRRTAVRGVRRPCQFYAAKYPLRRIPAERKSPHRSPCGRRTYLPKPSRTSSLFRYVHALSVIFTVRVLSLSL